MKATSTDEKNWTPREREIAADIRADGNKIECRIENGRRVFKIIEADDGTRPMIRTTPGVVKIGADACTVRLTGKPKK